MNVRHEPTHRHAHNDGDSHLDARLGAGSVESTSTRVLLDGGPHRCVSCDGVIGRKERYKCLTVRDDDGHVSELGFCGEDCLSARFRRERYRVDAPQ
jgi:hypothetical protein